MSEKPPKQMKGFGRKLLSRRRYFSLSRVAIGDRHKVAYHRRVRQRLSCPYVDRLSLTGSRRLNAHIWRLANYECMSK